MPSNGIYNALNQPVITSTLAFQKDFDSFFNPVTYNHNGFAFDGVWYAKGVPDTSRKASWSTEATSSFRSGSSSFPTTALILVSNASLSIYDATGEQLMLWMVFLLADGNALTDNFSSGTVGYSPQQVTWANGLLNVAYEPDPGSTSTAPISVTVDFTQDQVFLDTCLSAS